MDAWIGVHCFPTIERTLYWSSSSTGSRTTAKSFVGINSVPSAVGIEATTDSAFYLLGGIYLEDNLGKLIAGKENKWNFTPSFGLGYYDDGNGKKLGNKLEFRTTLELSYQLKNDDRIGFSLGHISNANIGNKNPGVEIISLSYQKPF